MTPSSSSLSLAALAVFMSSYSSGQELMKRVYKNDSLVYRETYFVRKDDPSIRAGVYERSSRKLLLKGQYENNQRTGTWDAYGDEGEPEQRIDFTNHTVTNFTKTNTGKKFWLFEKDSLVEIIPDEVPELIGGYSWFLHYLVVNLRYPGDARENNIQGNVILSATITTEGKMTDERIESGPGHGLNEDALRVLQKIPDEWLPGKMNGSVVDMRIQIAVSYRLATY